MNQTNGCTMAEFTVNGFRMHYDMKGKGDPLLLLHGLGSKGSDWKPQVDYFSQKYTVILPDMRGHGQSAIMKGKYSIPIFAEDVASLLQFLGIASTHIAGISMGGAIAQQLAVSHPERVKTLMVINAQPDFRMYTLKNKWKLMQRFLIIRIMGMRKMGEFLGERLLPKQEHALLRKRFADDWELNNKSAYLKAMKAVTHWDILDNYESIDCPVLFLASDQDYTSVSKKKAFSDRMKHAKLEVIHNAHHAVTIEHPERVNAVMDLFMTHNF